MAVKIAQGTVGLCVYLVLAAAVAQTPPPSRTVYKCEVEGRTQYSDAPCLGAKRVDVEPTRGLGSMTGKGAPGADVRNENLNETFSNAVRPITGQSPAERAKAARRFKLDRSAQAECRSLDSSIPRAEQMELGAKGTKLAGVQQNLFQMRARAFELGC